MLSICYAGLGSRMHPRNLVFITVLTLCHLQVAGQMLTNALPPLQDSSTAVKPVSTVPELQLPDDPGQEAIPVAQPEPAPATGVPVRWESDRQTRVGDTWSLSGNVVIHYRDYIVRADRITYRQSTSELEAEGNLQVSGGPADAYIEASHGEMRLSLHTARFYDVNGSL